MELLELVRGSTFDDFLFTPQHGVLSRRDPALVDLSTPFSEHIRLQRPLVSANMDTITRAAMAVVLAEGGWNRSHRSWISRRRYPAAGNRGHRSQANAARRH